MKVVVNIMVKHRQLFPIKTGTDSYNVNCIFGLLTINKQEIKKSEVWTITPHFHNKYSLALTKEYLNNYQTERLVLFKSLENALIAIQKLCDDYYREEIKFWYE